MKQSYLAVTILSIGLASMQAHAQSTTGNQMPMGPGQMAGPPGGSAGGPPPQGGQGMQGGAGQQGGQGGQNGHPHGPPPNITQAIQLLDEAKQKATSSDVLNLITQAETLLKQPPPRRQGGGQPGQGGPGQGSGQGESGGPPSSAMQGPGDAPTGNTTTGFNRH